jgi:Ras-related protein Rab-6A
MLQNSAPAEVTSSVPAASIAPLAKYKFVFLGDQSVGKTAIIQRFIFSTFDTTYQATIGIDFLSRSLVLEDKTIRLQIWDTAGQERFRSLTPSYIRDSSVAVVVYDITVRASFLNSSKWIEDVRVERGQDVVIMLVGNKSDLADKRQVSTEEAAEKARSEGALFIETSAKTGTNIKTLFRRVAMALPGLEDSNVGDENSLIDVELSPTPQTAVQAESTCGC